MSVVVQAVAERITAFLIYYKLFNTLHHALLFERACCPKHMILVNEDTACIAHAQLLSTDDTWT